MQPQFRAPVDRTLVRKHEKVIDEFAKFMKMRVKKMLGEKSQKPLIEPTLENLLDQRRALVRAVEEGMLERKDQEEIIGILAAMIWFNRLEESEQANITEW